MQTVPAVELALAIFALILGAIALKRMTLSMLQARAERLLSRLFLPFGPRPLSVRKGISN